MKNQEIWDIYEGLQELIEDENIKFDAITSFLIAKNKNILKPFFESINETRRKLFEKYGNQTEEGWFIPTEKVSLFEKEYENLMQIETLITLDFIPLENLKEEKIKIQTMEKILPLIEYKK